MAKAHGIELDRDGADLFSFRTALDSTTRVLVYLHGEYLGGFIGNADADGSDYLPGRRGPADGHYLLKPKPEADYAHGPTEYLPGTPSITGPGRPIGSPSAGWKNTVRFHPCGGSTGCQTAPREWADRIWDLVARYPHNTHLWLQTVARRRKIPTGPLLPKPQSHSWPPFDDRGEPPETTAEKRTELAGLWRKFLSVRNRLKQS